MKIFKTSLLALALTTATSAYAQSIAITNATVHTVTEQGVLTDATVVIDEGKILAINPENVEADVVVDAKGKILTPGLIGSVNQLGLVEVSAVARSRDAGDKKADITFDPSVAFNPRSSAIAYTRKGGITSNLVVPTGGDSIFKGLGFVADLSGEFDSIVSNGDVVWVGLGAQSEGSRAMALQKLYRKLEDAQKKLAKAKKEKSDDKKADEKEPKRDEAIVNGLLSGEKTLLVYANRATDLLALIDMKDKFNIKLVAVGAGDAVLVADKLAKAQVPVVISAMSNLPSSFDTLHQSLNNASILTNAGVKVLLNVSGDTHNLYQLRFDAGNSVANGMTKAQALAAVTANVADAFDINAGRIEVGKRADLVLWSNDPFELSTKVEQMWINGKSYSTESRQDALRDRYTTESDMPRAYTK